MNFRMFLVAVLMGAFAVFAVVSPVAAIATPPSFPSCINPTGAVVADNTGEHGIVGDSTPHSGADKVFAVTESTLIQCFCPASGSGIQTNWWKVSELSQADIDAFAKLGWIFVPDGSVWGLESSQYLAINLSFSCNGGGGGGGGSGAPVCPDTKPPTPQLLSVVRNGSTAKLTWTAVTPVTHYSIVYGTQVGTYIYGVANTGNVTTFTVGSLDPNTVYYFEIRAVNNCAPSDSARQAQVLGASTIGEVLGLAGTGTTGMMLALFGVGSVALLVGLYWRRHEI